MRQFGISKMEFLTITDQELDCQTSKITAEFPHCGEGIIKQILLGKNIKVHDGDYARVYIESVLKA